MPAGNDPFYPPTSPYSAAATPLSTASLLSQPDSEVDDDHGDDDGVSLTQHMSLHPSPASWRSPADVHIDAERTGGMTPRSRRRTVRYSRASSLKKTGSAIKSVSRSLHRASLRVVNLSNAALESQVRLPDDDEDLSEKEDGALQQQQEQRGRTFLLRGRTLGFFGPESKVRLSLYHFLVHRWTEPFILILIIINAVVLTLQSARSLTLPANGSAITSQGYFHTWEDFALFVIFIVYTLEAFARICVSGFLFDPEILLPSLFSPSFYRDSETTPASASASLSRQPSVSRGASIKRILHKIQLVLLRPFTLAPAAKRHYPHQSISTSNNGSTSTVTEKLTGAAQEAHDPSHLTYLSNIMKSDSDTLSLPFKLNVDHIHDKTRRNLPYLRHSWSRIDFCAIVSFWIALALALAGLERGSHHIGVFRAISVIRCARLLAITSGTTTIMHSLKMARPLLASTAYFVVFAMILFSIIGVQSFRGSLRRSCYLQATLGENQTQLPQFCGGHIDPSTQEVSGYVKMDGSIARTFKGFICPLGQLCIEAGNPNSNIQSFDTIYNAALQVIVIASANTWSQLMYNMLDAEYFVSCIFFIICIIILNFWLFNLFVAVITNTFHSIREVTNKSAFGAVPLAPSVVDEQEDAYPRTGRNMPKRNIAYIIISHTEWCWILLAFASLVLQATRTVNTNGWKLVLLFYGELGITMAFDVEAFLRIWAAFPDWRSFFRSGRNVFDLVLAVGSSVIQIPTIHSSSVYPWFTVFQLARFYRVILVVPNMKPLMLAVFGNLYGLLNMTFFLLLVNYLAALVAVQFLRGDISNTNLMNFGNVYNSFLAVYQLCSSENWTTVLYNVAIAEVPLGQTVIALVYLAFWLIFSYFIILQMFIAVLNENFSVAEGLKKSKQASSYWAMQRSSGEEARPSWMRKLNPYRWLKANPVTVKVDNLPSNLVLPMQKSLVQDYNRVPLPERSKSKSKGAWKPGHYTTRSITALHRLFVGETNSSDIPLRNLRQASNSEVDGEVQDEDESDRHLALLAAINGAGANNDDLNDVLYERRAQKADFIRNHPSYDKTFWIFSQKNPLRRMCQKLVQPANGERLFGTPCSTVAHPIFQLMLLLAVTGGIVVESVATPLRRREHYAKQGLTRFSWFDVADTVFGLTLITEFLIKIVADGFLFTPNAYVKSIWNVLDFSVMVGFMVNITTRLIFIGGLSRLTRGLKALPVLRLITLIDRMRYTFQSLLIAGAPGIIDAAILCILYMIPYAVWGLNIFAGKMDQCNDTSVQGLSDCIYEYNKPVFGTALGFIAPRVWNKPAPSTVFSFDSFRDSLLILFEIVSLEGWIDVLGVATSVTGTNSQPQLGSSPANALFFVIYNLLGGVVLLTIFVSIIIANFSAQTGIAYLTGPQREWIDLQKLIKRQRPSKRPKVRPAGGLRGWCFDRAVQKHGWWSRAMTVLIVLHIFALMTQSYNSSGESDRLRNFFFLVFTATYIVDVVVRSFGLGWSSFRANGWNLFDLFISIGSFITTATVQSGNTGYAIEQLQKLFLVSIAFKLVQRTDSLNMLFKTSVSSLPAILSLLGLWVIFFIFFAILYLEVFGMTKWGSAETHNQNYTTLARSIVMLIFMSTGEGWNQYMHDFDLTYPRCTITKDESDCGSTAWSFSLFIAWNLLSMYIFANLFTGVVVQNFSYVFQASESSTKSITREQMRAFKKVWAEFADAKTGYLHPSQFGCFFSRLTGVFEVRIYPTENSVSNILASCKADRRSKPANIINGIDTGKLAKKLSKIDYTAIRKRKLIYSRVFHEARISHQGRGISFTDMLLLLAHHKIIVDADALVLKDLLVRTETNKLVTDLVNLDRVRSLLKTLAARRRYSEEREKMMLADVPSIIVDVMPSTPPSSSRDISSALYDFSLSPSVPGSPSASERRYSPLDTSFGLEDAPRLQRSPRRISDVSMLSADLGSRSPRISFQDDDPQVILSSVKNSMWGELMQKAAEEEEHRF